MSEKIAIYTCIYGNFDKVKTILNYRDNRKFFFYCITDNQDLDTKEYKKLIIEKPFNSDRKSCRFQKVIIPDFLSKFDKVLYHDGNLQLDYNQLEALLANHEKCTLGTFKHEKRDCAYDEILACLYHHKEKKWRLVLYALRLWLKRYPSNNTLYETGILIRDVTSYNDSKLGERWWDEIQNFTIRDQLSLGYALDKVNYPVSFIPGFQFDNNYTKAYKHSVVSKKRQKSTFMSKLVYKLVVLLKNSKRVSKL